MLHIKMFMSNAVQKIIQTNNNGEFAVHVQIKEATNRITSVQHSKWIRSVNSPASLLSHFASPGKIEGCLQIPCLAPVL